MRISARRSDNGTFTLNFDQTEVTLTVADLKTLLFQVTRMITPESMKADQDVAKMASVMADELKTINDVSIQHLIQAADDEDILVLLKLGEEDEDLLNKLYGNMSDRLHQMFEEDLGFKYGSGMPDNLARSAIKRLHETVARLKADGLITETP